MSHIRSEISRRDWLRLLAAGAVGGGASGWLKALAADAAEHPQRRRACILLWMPGGPSQMDTFDLKPGHANGGEFKEIATSVPGIKISEHLPRLAARMQHLAVVRSMSTKEGDHGRATFLLRTGYLPQGPIQYPSLGSLVARELGWDEQALPGYVSIAPTRIFNQAAFAPGFLGPNYAPLIVGETQPGTPTNAGTAGNFRVPDLEAPTGVRTDEVAARTTLLDEFETDFQARHPGTLGRSHHAAYQRAVRLMRSDASRAFDLSDEPPALRDAYGRSSFGQGCLLARRLVERGVPFVEVSLSGVGNGVLGWDTHARNFPAVKGLSEVLDPAWATLLDDLKDRGLLDTTLVVWMGEFGRTPKINGNQGRDHFPNAWSTVLSGGGIRGGQVVGRTSADGTTVEDRPVAVPDLLSTVCRAIGIDPEKQNASNVGRPIRIVDLAARPLQEVLA